MASETVSTDQIKLEKLIKEAEQLYENFKFQKESAYASNTKVNNILL